MKKNGVEVHNTEMCKHIDLVRRSLATWKCYECEQVFTLHDLIEMEVTEKK